MGHDLTPHASSARIAAAMERLVPCARPWSGVCYRATDVPWSRSLDLFKGEGARLRGGRWNPPGLAAAYASLLPEVALVEGLAWSRGIDIPDTSMLPLVIAWGRVRIARLLDLTCGEEDRELWQLLLDPSAVDWKSENAAGRETTTQALGRLAIDVSIEGLLVPSTAIAGAVNLVIFPESLGLGSEITGHGLEP